MLFRFQLTDSKFYGLFFFLMSSVTWHRFSLCVNFSPCSALGSLPGAGSGCLQRQADTVSEAACAGRGGKSCQLWQYIFPAGSHPSCQAHLGHKFSPLFQGKSLQQIRSLFNESGLPKPVIITLLTPPDPGVTAESCWKLPLCNQMGPNNGSHRSHPAIGTGPQGWISHTSPSRVPLWHSAMSTPMSWAVLLDRILVPLLLRHRFQALAARLQSQIVQKQCKRLTPIFHFFIYKVASEVLPWSVINHLLLRRDYALKFRKQPHWEHSRWRKNNYLITRFCDLFFTVEPLAIPLLKHI